MRKEHPSQVRLDWLDDDETRSYLLQLRKEIEAARRRLEGMAESGDLEEIRKEAGYLRGLKKALKLSGLGKEDDDEGTDGPAEE